jgi:hypothetical protein
MVALSLPKNDAQFAGPFEALVDRIGKAVNTFCAIPKTTDEDMERARLTMQTLTHTLQTMAKKLKEVKPTNLAVQNFVEAFVSQIGNGSTEKGIFEDALCPNNAEAINDAEVIKLVALTNSSIKLLENDVEITKERWKALQQQTAAAPMQSPMGSASAASSGLHQLSASNLPLVNPFSSAASPMHGPMASTQPSAHLPGLSNPAHELPALPLSAAPSAAASPSVVVVHAPATASATATAAPAPVLTAKEQTLETEQATSDLVAEIAFETVVSEGDNFNSEAKEIARKRIAELQEQLGKLQSK